jgi:prepilin signal peptidase PulO-like enzyme (type II secretory pathway)
VKLKKLNLANTHLVSILFSLIFIIFFFKAIFLKFLLTALVFQIYLRVLNFSFVYIQAFSSNLNSQSISDQETNTQSVVTLKTIGSLSRAIFSAFLLFLLVKYFSIGADVLLLAVSGLIISFIAYGYISSRKQTVTKTQEMDKVENAENGVVSQSLLEEPDGT